jgi:hypothetical protein
VPGESSYVLVAASGGVSSLTWQPVANDGLSLVRRMLGSELAEFAQKMFPRLNFVLMSGKDPPRLTANARFLRKPFMPEDLLTAVRVG